MTDSITAIAGEIRDQAQQMGIALFRIVITFAVAWAVARFARNYIEPRMAHKRYGRDGALLIGRLVSIGAYVAAFVSVMNQFNVNWTGILALLSAFTVAIGLSLQDVLKNFFSGILMLLERPFSVGDRVKVRDFEGEIQGIDVRTTLIRNRDGALVYVPNSIMFGDILTNRSHFRTRRLDITIKDPTRSVEAVEAAVHEAVATHADLRKPVPSPTIKTLSTEGVTLSYSFLVQSATNVDHEIMLALANALDGASIEVSE